MWSCVRCVCGSVVLSGDGVCVGLWGGNKCFSHLE